MQITSFSLLVLSFFALHAFAFPSFSTPYYSLLARKEHGANKTANGTQSGNSIHAHSHKAQNSTKSMCSEMQQLMHLAKIAGNDTAAAAFTAKANNVTNAADKLKSATTKLASMSSNTTLVAECATIDATEETKSQCKKMEKLTKLAAVAKNSTAMQEIMSKAKNSTKEMDAINGAAAKLATMSGNSTLTDLCAAEKAAKSSKCTFLPVSDLICWAGMLT